MPKHIDLTAVTATGADIEHILQSTQGHILEKHRRDHVWNVLLRFNPGCQIASLLAALPTVCSIPSASDLRTERDVIIEQLNAGVAPKTRGAVCFLGLTATGCRQIGGNLAGFSIPFQDGAQSRVTAKLGSNAELWDGYWKGDPFHAILVCCAESTNDLVALLAKLQQHFGNCADMILEKGAVIRRQGVGARKGYAIEHFGFADGISQPSLKTDGNPPPAYHSGYNPEAALNTILIRDPLLRNDCAFGSYMAYLKIEQNVDRFNQVAVGFGRTPSPPDSGLTQAALGAALLIGRHRDGTPLIGGGPDDNDFSRQLDRNGINWPFASHICKMNPRDSVNRTFIIRRGITYDDGSSKGLLFQSFQADLEFQFELLVSTWARDPNHPVAGSGSDSLAVTMPSQKGSSGSTSWASPGVSDVVTLRGGEYFYFPSIPAIKAFGHQTAVKHTPSKRAPTKPVQPKKAARR